MCFLQSIFVESNKLIKGINHVVISSDNQGNQDTKFCKARVFPCKIRVPTIYGW